LRSFYSELNSEKHEGKSHRRNTSFFIIASTLCLAVLATVANNGQSAIAQSPTVQGQSNSNAPISFFLKLGNNQSTSTAATQAASNGTGTKNITITVNVQKGASGNPIKLPISAVVPNNTNPQDLQLCAALSNGGQSCQPLGGQNTSIDLSKGANNSNAAGQQPSATPQSYNENSGIISKIASSLKSLFTTPSQYAYAQLLSLNNTTVNIPVTVIVPITIEIQNAQICASVASSGGQYCQQLVLNPSQTAFTPVNIDLASGATPTISTAAATEPTQTTSTTSPTTATNNTTQSTSSSPSTTTSSGSSDNQTSGSTDNTNTNTQPSDSSSGNDTSSP
jgi:hypothetical protein